MTNMKGANQVTLFVMAGNKIKPNKFKKRELKILKSVIEDQPKEKNEVLIYSISQLTFNNSIKFNFSHY